MSACLAAEWHRDGRGLWASRICTCPAGSEHGPRHQFSAWRYYNGTWPVASQKRAFVTGATWWQFHANGATAFTSERDEMEAEAVRRYGDTEAEREA